MRPILLMLLMVTSRFCLENGGGTTCVRTWLDRDQDVEGSSEHFYKHKKQSQLRRNLPYSALHVIIHMTKFEICTVELHCANVLGSLTWRCPAKENSANADIPHERAKSGWNNDVSQAQHGKRVSSCWAGEAGEQELHGGLNSSRHGHLEVQKQESRAY